MMGYAVDYLVGSLKANVEATATDVAKSFSEKVEEVQNTLPPLPDASQARFEEARRTRLAVTEKYARLRQLEAEEKRPESVEQQRNFLYFKQLIKWREVKALAELTYQKTCYLNQQGIKTAEDTVKLLSKLREAKNWYSLVFLAKECDQNYPLIKEIVDTHSLLPVKSKKDEKLLIEKAFVQRWHEMFNEYQRLLQFIYEQKCRYRLFAQTITPAQRQRAEDLERLLSTKTLEELVQTERKLYIKPAK